MKEILERADLMGMPRVETYYRIEKNIQLEDPINHAEFDDWIREKEKLFCKRGIRIRLGQWLQMITKRSYGKEEGNQRCL